MPQVHKYPLLTGDAESRGKGRHRGMQLTVLLHWLNNTWVQFYNVGRTLPGTVIQDRSHLNKKKYPTLGP